MLKSSDATNFFASSYHFKEFLLEFFYFQKVVQGHEVKFSQLHDSMANVKIYKCRPQIFALALTICDKLIF